MFKQSLILFCLIFSFEVFAKSKFIVEISSGIGNKPIIKKFDVSPLKNIDHTIWVSKNGIKCTFGPWAGKEVATLECNGPDNYMVQSTFSCKINKNKKTKGYLWVGKMFVKNGHRSFRVYCSTR